MPMVAVVPSATCVVAVDGMMASQLLLDVPTVVGISTVAGIFAAACVSDVAGFS
jgi:hypothetical protein